MQEEQALDISSAPELPLLMAASICTPQQLCRAVHVAGHLAHAYTVIGSPSESTTVQQL